MELMGHLTRSVFERYNITSAAGPCTLWLGAVRHVRALRVGPAGESLPCDKPLRVGNGLDPLADLLR
jgi:hypothetical protein